MRSNDERISWLIPQNVEKGQWRRNGISERIFWQLKVSRFSRLAQGRRRERGKEENRKTQVELWKSNCSQSDAVILEADAAIQKFFLILISTRRRGTHKGSSKAKLKRRADGRLVHERREYCQWFHFVEDERETRIKAQRLQHRWRRRNTYHEAAVGWTFLCVIVWCGGGALRGETHTLSPSLSEDKSRRQRGSEQKERSGEERDRSRYQNNEQQ